LCLGLLWFPRVSRGGKTWTLVWSGIFLVCDVLAYPSMIMLFPICIIYLCIICKRVAWKEIFKLSIPCFMGALLLICHVLSYMTIEQLFEVVPKIMGDGSHDVTMTEKLEEVFSSFGEVALLLMGTSAVSILLVGIYCIWKHKNPITKEIKAGVVLLTFGILSIHQMYCYFTSDFIASYPHVIYLYVCLVGVFFCFGKRYPDKRGQFLIFYSFVNYIGVILLSNWEPIHLMPYLIVGVVGSLVYWKNYLVDCFRLGEKLFGIVCAVMVFTNIWGYCYLMIGGPEANTSIFEVGGYCKKGVNAGIFAEYMTAYQYNANQELWPEAIPAGSSVMYVGNMQSFYMQGKCVIATGNTISTPTYNESLLEYWEVNPERYPDVVVVECVYDSVIVEEDSYIMRWLKDEFQASEVVHYPYIIVYKK